MLGDGLARQKIARSKDDLRKAPVPVDAGSPGDSVITTGNESAGHCQKAESSWGSLSEDAIRGDSGNEGHSCLISLFLFFLFAGAPHSESQWGNSTCL